MSAFDITLTNGEYTAQGWRTNEPIVPSQGYGGHPIGARPKRRALTVFEGRQPFTMVVPMLLFRGGAGQSVEQDRIALDEMATVEDLTTVKHQKGVYILAGPGVILPVPPKLVGSEWWIEDMSWGEEVRDNTGAMTRKNVTVTLLERVDDVTLGEQAEQAAHKPGSPVEVKYLVKKGDTLHSIAAHRLGSASRWTEIKALNPSIRSDGDLHPGKTTLRLPAPGVTYHNTKLGGVFSFAQPTSGSG